MVCPPPVVPTPRPPVQTAEPIAFPRVDREAYAKDPVPALEAAYSGAGEAYRSCRVELKSCLDQAREQ